MSEDRQAGHPPLGARGIVAALGAGAAASGFWIAMTGAFHLIFHLQPALIGIGAGWALRRVAGPGLAAGPLVTVTVVSAGGAAAGMAAISGLGGATDPVWFTAVVSAAGALLGVFLLTRPRGRDVTPVGYSGAETADSAVSPATDREPDRT